MAAELQSLVCCPSSGDWPNRAAASSFQAGAPSGSLSAHTAEFKMPFPRPELTETPPESLTALQHLELSVHPATLNCAEFFASND